MGGSFRDVRHFRMIPTKLYYKYKKNLVILHSIGKKFHINLMVACKVNL